MNTSVQYFVNISRDHNQACIRKREWNKEQQYKNVLRKMTQTFIPHWKSSFASGNMPRSTYDLALSTKIIAAWKANMQAYSQS